MKFLKVIYNDKCGGLMKRKLIKWILLLGWVGLIFFFSHQPAVESSKMSNGVIDNVINIVENIFDYEFDEDEIDLVYKYAVFPIRKLAHLTIYFILGILVFLVVREYNVDLKKAFVISILFCILYASSDEIHQLFIIGRSSELRDVLIDTFGSLLGIMLSKKMKLR